MKVLILAPGNSPHSKRLIELLLEEGCRVTCVDGQNPLPSAANGYEFIPLPGVRGIRFRWFRNHLEARVRGRQLRRIWEQVRPDVVNVHFADVRAEACVKGQLQPLVLSCWGNDIFVLFNPEGADPSLRRRIGATLAAADYLTADSPEILRLCGLLTDRQVPSKLFFFGIDPKLFKPGYEGEARALRQKLGIPPGRKIVFSPRRVMPVFHQMDMLESLAAIGRSDAVLLLREYLISSTEYAQQLRLRAAQLGLQDRVFWLGETTYAEVPVHYALADLVVNYPEYDAFPVTLFEAAMCQRPVITSRLPSYEGVFGDAFVNVPPADPAALTAALKQCLTEPPEQTRQRVERAYAIALEVGDQRKCVKVMMEIYRTVTQEKKHGDYRQN